MKHSGLQEVANVADLEVDTGSDSAAGTGTQWGTGGMATKLTAARIACAAGCSMAICNSSRPGAIEQIVAGERCGTVFRPLAARVADKKRWLLTGAPHTYSAMYVHALQRSGCCRQRPHVVCLLLTTTDMCHKWLSNA